MTTFQKVLEKYRKYSFSERDKGDRFEKLMQTYLLTDPYYSGMFKQVWMWNDFPANKDLGGKDTGIDLVALTHEGDFWAIQCKCFQESSSIDKKAVDSFLSTSSREFKNEQLQTVRFSQRLWISTTNKWGSTAEETIKNQNPPVSRINLYDLEQAPVDWEKLENGISGELARTAKKSVRQHQKEALDKIHNHFKENERGKLIMACGTGKTYTSLKIAENETQGKGLVLFLVPSIALLGQTLREWSSDSDDPIKAICICSDSRITKQNSNNDDTTDFSVVDLALPASTDVKSIVHQFKSSANHKGMTVVFSTYQSIDVIAKAQKELIHQNIKAEFDLIICDEAHRTTGVAISKDDESAFTKVHDNNIIKAKKRLYMTATPRLYSDESISKAEQNDALICSMDDVSIYGEEIYRIGFGEAVERDLLTDYKVLILTLNDKDIPASVQKMISNEDSEITSDDASKLIGCINALSKQVLGDEGLLKSSDPEPMKRAVAFCQNIKVSKRITTTFNDTTELYLDSVSDKARKKMVSISSEHIDGSMNAPQRDELLGWLKSTDTEPNECRVLTNVRCLSEGVDVPSLDAVLFLSARNSQVDVVQSVGRVMRKSPGKKYGYIIIPVLVPSDVEPSKALDNNDRFKVVWTVLNALRAHDDRFNATVNKIELNKKKPSSILVGGASHGEDYGDGTENTNTTKDVAEQIALQFQELQGIMYAKMVQKVGDRVYWEKWAKDVAIIAENQMERINNLIEQNKNHKDAFYLFLLGLQKNINPSITKQQAVEMLSQHIITKPVFEALFEGYSFVNNNAISKAMQSMLDVLEDTVIEKENSTLDKFYESVKKRASGIDNAEGKQRIIIELYDKFFKSAFPKMVEQLGIVYTPVEVVDFIIHSVNDVLKKEFSRSISDENVHILDPFTGTGTFITRLLQSGLIAEKDLIRKYTQELHANEIVLLAYYIAAVNIENAFHDATLDPDDGLGKEKYIPFDGIVLTDTFQLGETDESEQLFSEMFPQNSARVQKQKDAPIRVIMGNPPYSVGQKSADDNAQNQEYKKLDNRISETYQSSSSGPGRRALYDAYIKAFRWSTDRLDPKNGGVIAFVSNNSWLDGIATSGFRLYIEKEFTSIYVFDLRGSIRGKSGTSAKKEGQNVFDIMTGVAITLLVKNPDVITDKAKVHYYDIGDFLNRKEKIKILTDFKSFDNENLAFNIIKPNIEGDWLSQRNSIFSDFIAIGEKDIKKDEKITFFKPIYSYGIVSNRDNWVWNYSNSKLVTNVETTIDFYSDELKRFQEEKKTNPNLKAKDFITYDVKKISWDNRRLIGGIDRNKTIKFDSGNIRTGLYRPFSKHLIYFSLELCHSLYLQKSFFPTKKHANKSICISKNNDEGLSILISDSIVDIHLNGDTQSFPLYYYEKREKVQGNLFDANSEDEYIKRDGVSDFILQRAIKSYGKAVNKEDIFYYVYGILHSPDYRTAFANDLKKMLPRIPLVDEPRDFWKFSKAGRTLAELHVNYENVEPYSEVIVKGDKGDNYKVSKMKFPKKDQKETIVYNSQITLENIPEKAYEYVVNGKSAIEWILERYQVTTDKKSGITNNPNDWADEVGNPRYILDLLLSVINVSVQTVDIVNELPKLKFE